MKKIVPLPLLALFAGCVSIAQEYPTSAPPPPPDGDVVYAPAGAAAFNPQQLEQLLAPIALYPDPLLALILPASTNFPELTQAAQFLATGGAVNQVELQPWDDSVRALAHYPQIVRWMAENPAWTQQLGDAFAAQPDNVMSAVQRLRARARAAGTLVDTPQQVVVYEGETIAIEPADPNVIYVPYYDPTIVYERPYAFSYSPAFVTGWWLCFGLDWNRHHVWAVDRGERERWWRDHRRDWNRPRPSEHQLPPQAHAWHPQRGNWPNRNDAGSWRGTPRAPDNRNDRHDGPRPDNRQPDERRDNWHQRDAGAAPTQGVRPATAPSTRPPNGDSWRTRTPANTPATAPTPAPTPAVSSPAPSPTPRDAWRHDRGGASMYNPSAPQPTRTYTPPPPTPSAALPGVTNTPVTAPAPVRNYPAPTQSTPAPGYTPPARGGGWQHGGGAPVQHTTPPPQQPSPQPPPQQQQQPPPGRGDGRHDRGGDSER